MGADSDKRFKAVLEVTKYPVKSTDYLSGDDLIGERRQVDMFARYASKIGRASCRERV